LAFDLATGNVVQSEVIETMAYRGMFRVLKLDINDKDSIQVTPEHPLFNGKRWESPLQAARESRVFTITAGTLPLSVGTSLPPRKRVVYNLRTSAGSYLIGKHGLVASDRAVVDAMRLGTQSANTNVDRAECHRGIESVSRGGRTGGR
jgi:hypothetical protein